MDTDGKVMATVIACAALITAIITSLIIADQATDQRIATLVKAGVDPGKAACAMRMNGMYCPLILAGINEKAQRTPDGVEKADPRP